MLTLPQNISGKEQFKALSSRQKEEYSNSLLKEVLKLNPNGVTVSQLYQALPHFGRSTLWHHMEILSSRAECLRIERGDTDVYHSNNVMAALKELEFEEDRKKYYYSLHLVENTFGEFIRIQRKQENRFGEVVPYSGVLLPYNIIGNVIESLNQFKEFRSAPKDNNN